MMVGLRAIAHEARRLGTELDAVAANDVVLALHLVHLNTPDSTPLTRERLNLVRLSVTASAHEDRVATVLRLVYLRRHRQAVIDVLRLCDSIETGLAYGIEAPTVRDLLDTFPFHHTADPGPRATVESTRRESS